MDHIAPVEKPTVVLVQGAFHAPDCWGTVTAQLRNTTAHFIRSSYHQTGGDLTVTAADDAAQTQELRPSPWPTGKL
jgi:hypothetical protein